MFLAVVAYQEPGCQCVSSYPVSSSDPVIALAELHKAGHVSGNLEFTEVLIFENGATHPTYVTGFTASEV